MLLFFFLKRKEEKRKYLLIIIKKKNADTNIQYTDNNQKMSNTFKVLDICKIKNKDKLEINNVKHYLKNDYLKIEIINLIKNMKDFNQNIVNLDVNKSFNRFELSFNRFELSFNRFELSFNRSELSFNRSELLSVTSDYLERILPKVWNLRKVKLRNVGNTHACSLQKQKGNLKRRNKHLRHIETQGRGNS